MTICRCGEPIEPCHCGGTACPGWLHIGPFAGHWCDNNHKASPKEGYPNAVPGV